jgi:type IV secretory pathway TrbF-like protein
MVDPSNAVLTYWSEHREQMRQSENQRATMTNYVLVIAAALAGFIVQQGFHARTIPLSLLITAIGLYGAASAAKYHERAVYHLRQARALTHVLCDLGALPDSSDALTAARQAHYARYPRLHRLRLHDLWTGLHLAIATLGAGLAAIACIAALT